MRWGGEGHPDTPDSSWKGTKTPSFASSQGKETPNEREQGLLLQRGPGPGEQFLEACRETFRLLKLLKCGEHASVCVGVGVGV